MAGITLDQFLQMPDALLTHRFLLEVSPPNGGGEALTIRCQTGVVPGYTINPVEVALHGFKRSEFGIKEFQRTMEFQFIETRDGVAWNTLKGWQELVRGTRSGSSAAPRRDLVRTAIITVLDEQDKESVKSEAYGCWPTAVPDVNLDGQSEQPFLIPCTMQYDYVTYLGVEVR